ncbi:MAG: hypothetical protein DRI46_14215 [Chloroflexi bacterium]|nr:MAG: hypothetical protein DRI46_14215 [Chloroflexota bacterium]
MPSQLLSCGLGTSLSEEVVQWTNTNNITVDDANYAESSASKNANTSTLVGSTFGFSIPIGSTIDGIILNITKAELANQTAFEYNAVNLSLNGGVIGANKASYDPWPSGESNRVVAVYGGATDTWGGSWSAADINDSTFAGQISAANISDEGSYAYVFYMSIEVFYTIPVAGPKDISATLSTEASLTSELIREIGVVLPEPHSVMFIGL